MTSSFSGRLLRLVLACAAVGLAAGTSRAESSPEPAGVGDHVEFSTGFITGARTYHKTAFTLRDAETDGLGGAAGLSAPFGAYPYDGIFVSGVRWDFRAVLSHVRMTLGFGLPFASPSSAGSTASYDVRGTQREVSAQSLQPYEARFGLGGEYALGRVALYADLLGDVHIVRTTLAIDGAQANFGATTFAFSAGAGVRVTLRAGFFLSAGAEIGIYGDTVWGAQLGAGYLIDT
jgi:hypothetical protein